MSVYPKPTPAYRRASCGHQEIRTMNTVSKEYDLPDGNVVTLKDESIYIPEVLFKTEDTVYLILEGKWCRRKKSVRNH